MKKITNILLSIGLISACLGAIALTSPVSAQVVSGPGMGPGGRDGSSVSDIVRDGDNAAPAQSESEAGDGKCAGVEVSYLDAICKGSGDGSDGNIENSGLWQILTGILNIMIAGVGVLAVAGIVYGSILYASAADNQEQVKNAMGIFRNVAIGLVTFAMMYSLLQFLIPGGVF